MRTRATHDLPQYVHPSGPGKWHFKRKGHTGKIPLKQPPGTSASPSAEWHAIMAAMSNDTLPLRVVPKDAKHVDAAGAQSVGNLVVAYLKSDYWAMLDRRTQVCQRLYIENCLTTVVADSKGNEAPFAHWHVEHLSQPHVIALRSALPEPKRQVRGTNAGIYRDTHVVNMRALFNWGIRMGLLKHNPFARVAPIVSQRRRGWYTWTDDDVAKFLRRHKLGTMPHLALMLLMSTVVRRSDVVRLGKAGMDGSALTFVEAKWATTKVRDVEPKHRAIQLRDELRAVIDATPGAWDGDTFLKTEKGGAFTLDTFAHEFQRWCLQAGLGADADGMMPVEAKAALVYDGKRYVAGERFRMRPADTITYRYRRIVRRHGTHSPSPHGVRKFVTTRADETGMADTLIAALLGHTSTKNLGPYRKKARNTVKFERAMDMLKLPM